MKKAGKLFLLFIIFLTFILRFIYYIQPVDPEMKTGRQIIIETGKTGQQVGRKLYKNDLIKSQFIFNLLLNLKGWENSLKASTYEIKPSYSMLEIMELLVKGKVATFRITIPEGFTVEALAERLAVLTPYDKEDYLKYAKTDLGRGYLAKNKDIKYQLEGFLYPDTYIIPQEFQPDQTLAVMLSLFEERWLERLRDITSKGNSKVVKFTPYQIMTIASLIEKEAKLDREKPLIAAVIYNRLEKNMLLQLDASIQYILGERKKRILYSDLKIDSPYNTYLYPGLPPGPVSNPGSAAIEAALNPAKVDYLFYFAKEDGSHVFTKTYQEHLRLQNEMRDRDE